MKYKLCADLRPYCSYRGELVVIDSIILKGRLIVIPNSLKQQVLNQLHINHMGIEKTKLLAHESVYWSSINADIKNYIKHCAMCLEFQQMQPKEKIIHHNIPLRPWEVVSANVFHFNNKNYLCIVDYHSKFPVIKRLERLSAESLVNTVKIILTKYGIPPKIMSDTGTNFISDMFQQFCKSINVEQAVLSAYHYKSNGQVEACIKFIKCTFKKCSQLGRDINMALLQNYTTLLGQGLPSPATLMFNRQVCGIMPVLDCKPIAQDCDDDHHKKLTHRQQKNNNDASPVFVCIPVGSAVAVQQEDGGPWTHGTIVRTGNQNHHNRSYTIQPTTNGRCITCNGQHIKPIIVTADVYLQDQSNKNSNVRTDPLVEILNNINKNPAVYANRQPINNKSLQQEAKAIEQCTKRADTSHKEGEGIPQDNKSAFQGSEVKKRPGHIVKKQTD